MSASRRPSPGATRRQVLALALAGTPWLASASGPGHVVRPWPSAKPVPALDLIDLDGKRWTLQALAGRVVLLNFWATWCEPCRAEMPSLEASARLHREAGLVVLAVNYKEPAATIRSFLERMPYRATILLDADGDAATAWTPRVFPEHDPDRPRRQAHGHRDGRSRLDRRRGARPRRAAACRLAEGLSDDARAVALDAIIRRREPDRSMTTSTELAGRHIVLGLSGGIACYKAAELTRELIRAGATVQIVMTEAAEHFITAVTLQALSTRPVFTSQWDAREANNMAHINLTREADAVLIAPASADFIAKLLHGRADDILSLMCLARPIERCPLLIAPAMNPRDVGPSGDATQRRPASLGRCVRARPGQR